MIAILASVRSTGTRFFTEIFKNAGLEYHQKNYISQVGVDLVDGLHASHCEPIHMGWLENRASDHPLFLPMRHPRKVAESWIKRGWAINNVFFAEWYNLFWLKEHYDGHWLPIDTPDRDDYLQKASEIVGRELTTDWQVFKATDTEFAPKGLTVEQAMKALRVMPFDYYEDL